VLDRRAFGKRTSIFDPTIRLDLEVRARRVETGTRSEGQEEVYRHNQHAGLSQQLAEQRITTATAGHP
jgi:hypothetical protein